MNSLLDKSAPLLKKGGQLSLAYPPERMGEVLRELEYRSLYPRQARFIHGNFQAPQKYFWFLPLKEKNPIVPSPRHSQFIIRTKPIRRK